MARTRSLSDMRSDIRIAADIVNQTTRHPNTQLTRWINESIQQFRVRASRLGHNYFSTTVDGTVTAGNAALSLTGSPEIVSILGIDLIREGRMHTVHPIGFAERNDWGGTGIAGATNAEQGPPMYYSVTGEGIFVYPDPDAAYSFRVHYLAPHEDLVNDADVFDGIAGWEDWVRADVCRKVAWRDRNTELYQTSREELDRVWADIAGTVPRFQHGGATRRIDTRGRRRGMRNWRETRFPS